MPQSFGAAVKLLKWSATILVLAAPIATPARIDGSISRNGNQIVKNFGAAKKLLPNLSKDWGKTLYCRCEYSGKRVDWASCGYEPQNDRKRAARIEWEHVVPAEAFGHSFPEWREGSDVCKTKKKKYKGRRCAEKNPAFNLMEADLYNLFPEVGEVNAARSNFSMAEVGGLGSFAGTSFGACKARVYQGKFEPMPFAKGTVARTYMYMEYAYPGHGIISEKNRKLFEAWDRQYPVEPWECERYRKILSVQKNENPILRDRCKGV